MGARKGDFMTKPTGNPRGRPRKDIAATPRMDADRADGGFENVFLNVGNSRDRTAYSRPTIAPLLGFTELEQLYEGNGFARRIVDLPSDEVTRAGYEVEGLDEGLGEQVEAILEGVGAQEALTEAVRYANLYGGALVVMIADDGASSLAEPLRIEKVRRIERLRVYDRWAVTRASYYTDPQDSRYGEVETYNISPVVSGVAATPYLVHSSRCLIFDGAPVSVRTRARNDGWGASMLQSAYDQIMRFGMSHYWANGLLERAQQAVHSLRGLGQQLRTKEGETAVRTRMELVDMARSMNNTVTIDGDGETYEVSSQSLSGVGDVIDRFGQALSAVTGIPETLLIGKQQTGLSNSGAGALENWYAKIGQDQKRKLLGPLDRLVQMALHSIKKYQPDYLIKFCPLWVPSDKEKAEVFKLEMEAHKLKAETAGAYVTMQALGAEEVRNQIAEEYDIAPMPLGLGPDPEDDTGEVD